MSDADVQPDPQRLDRELSKVWGRLRGNGGFILVTAAGITGSVSGADGMTWMLIPTLALGGLGVVLQLGLRPTYAELAQTAKHNEANAAQATQALQGALGTVLRTIAKKCAFDSNDQRISVYCHVDDAFVLLARHSTNPKFAQAGRPSYPSGESVIGQAWELGTKTVWDWPTDPDEWVENQMKLYKMPEPVLRGIRMKSASMTALRLDHGANHVGVMVMESMKPRGAKKQHFATARDAMLLECVVEIMVAAQPQFPSVAAYVLAKASAQAAASTPPSTWSRFTNRVRGRA